MICKTINYVDYNGVQREDKCYFNLTQAELAFMELEEEEGFKAKLERLSTTPNGPEIVKVFKDVIKKSYGVKSADGKRFVKDEKYFKEFSETEAYSQLVIDLLTNPESATQFMKGIVGMN